MSATPFLRLYGPSEPRSAGNRLKAADLGTAWQGFQAVCRLQASPAALEAHGLGRGHLTQLLSDPLRDVETLKRADQPGIRVLTDGLTPTHPARQLCGPDRPWRLTPTQLARQLCGPDGPWPMLPRPLPHPNHHPLLTPP
jgi:hypothetical protein